jgi:site-specific recombinase XerD
MFTLMLECGLRVGEVCNLSLDDVLLDEPPRLKIHGKGGRQRMVYLPPPAYSALKDWLTSRPVTKDRAVFISQRGKRLSVTGVQFILQGYCEKAGIQVTCHQFRHTCASMLLNAGMSILGVQRILGHKYVETTLRYARLYDSTVVKDFQRASSCR